MGSCVQNGFRTFVESICLCLKSLQCVMWCMSLHTHTVHSLRHKYTDLAQGHTCSGHMYWLSCASLSPVSLSLSTEESVPVFIIDTTWSKCVCVPPLCQQESLSNNEHHFHPYNCCLRATCRWTVELCRSFLLRMLKKLSFIHSPSVSFSVRTRNLNSHYAFISSKEYSFNWLCCFCACLRPFKFIYICCLNDRTLLGAQEYSFYCEHIVIKPNDQRKDQQQPTWQDICPIFALDPALSLSVCSDQLHSSSLELFSFGSFFTGQWAWNEVAPTN